MPYSALHGAGEHAYPVSQQGAVRRVMHIRFYDRGVDAKSTPVRDPGTLRDFNDVTIHVLNHLRAQCPRDLESFSRLARHRHRCV